jgi:hypothetical protein
LLDKYEPELTAIAEERGVSDFYELSESARYAVNNFLWGEEAIKVDQYMLTHPDTPLFDIWQLGGIYFRNILMKKYGIQFPGKLQEKRADADRGINTLSF